MPFQSDGSVSLPDICPLHKRDGAFEGSACAVLLCRAMRRRLAELEGDIEEQTKLTDDEAPTAVAEPADVAEDAMPVEDTLRTEHGANRIAATGQVQVEHSYGKEVVNGC